METNTAAAARKIDDIRSSHAILMIQTKSLCEVLRTYFEDKIGDGESIDISASTLVSFLFQVDDNLSRIEELSRELDCRGSV